MPTSRVKILCSCLLAALLFTGCMPEPEVETYTIPRTQSSRPALDPDAYLQQLDHILVAIVPQDDVAWFFKLVGKAAAVKRQRQPFQDFLSTVSSGESPEDTPSWDLPDGWEEKEAAEMRAATLVVPDEGGELELAVSSLPLNSDWEAFLVPNVNRWLGQLDRRPLSQATILELAQDAKTKSGSATVFELSGVMSQRPMGANPHAGLGIAPPSTSTTPAPQQSSELTYATPDGWLPGKMSSIRKAAFLLPGGGPADGVTVTRFPGGPGSQMADVAANVERWAGQVGAKVTADTLEEVTEPVQIGELEGTYVQLASPAEVELAVSLHVAMVEREGQVWFFKMSGKRDLVEGQSEAFRDFLRSVQFQ